MRKLILLIALVISGELALAQHSTGDKNLNLGIGLGSVVATGSTSVPPIGASFEYGIKDEISVGGYIGYTASNQDLGRGFAYKYSYLIIGARGSYHYYFVDDPKLDTYGGLMLGYNVASAKWDGNGADPGTSASVGGVAYSLFIGGRYAFTDQIGAFAELGYGISWLQIGANIKL